MSNARCVCVSTDTKYKPSILNLYKDIFILVFTINNALYSTAMYILITVF